MNKIEALRQTFYNLENDVYEYKWTDAGKCNCGVLAKTILGGREIFECGYTNSHKRTNLTDFSNYAYCMVTDTHLPLVFKVLKETGFTHQELLELENLSNPEILKSIGETSFLSTNGLYSICYLRGDKETVIAYLKAWVAKLEQESPKTKYVVKEVEVPETIRAMEAHLS